MYACREKREKKAGLRRLTALLLAIFALLLPVRLPVAQAASQTGTATANVILRQEENGAQVVSFSNDAPELTQEDVGHVFERFYTADKMRTGRNTGLGLAIVRELARQMELGLTARLEEGRFVVELRWEK